MTEAIRRHDRCQLWCMLWLWWCYCSPFPFLNNTVSMFTTSPISYSILFPHSLIALGRRASGRWLAHKNRGIVNKIGAFWKDKVQGEPLPLHHEDTVKFTSIRNSFSFPRRWLQCYPGLGLLGKVNSLVIGYTVHGIWMDTSRITPWYHFTHMFWPSSPKNSEDSGPLIYPEASSISIMV